MPLREVVIARAREPHRRWFSDDDFDLFVWFDGVGTISWFELCYDRSDVERALTWTPIRGYEHWRVSAGDDAGMNYDMTPILVPDNTEFPKDRIIAAFAAAANTLEPTVRSFVLQRLREVTGERQRSDWMGDLTDEVDVTPYTLTERELVPGWWSDKELPAWRPAVIAAVIAIGLALAFWLLSKT